MRNDCFLTHYAARITPRYSSPLQNPILTIERTVDQRVIRAVDLAVLVEIAVQPPADVCVRRGFEVEVGVDVGVVRAVDFAVEVAVAVPGILDEDGGAVVGF